MNKLKELIGSETIYGSKKSKYDFEDTYKPSDVKVICPETGKVLEVIPFLAKKPKKKFNKDLEK